MMGRLRKICVGILLLCLPLLAKGQHQFAALLPMPNELRIGMGNLQVPSEVAVKSNVPQGSICLSVLKDILQERMGVSVTEAGGSPCFELRINPLLPNREHYRVHVGTQGVLFEGATDGAVFYALQTFDQLLLGDVCATAHRQIKSVRIDDSPRFGYRALMLDPARHFLPVSDVKHFIDWMARFKYNVLQLHLTDDQGWRMEIKTYPQLVQKGAFRKEGGGADGPDNGYYTQQQLKELIAYAAARNIEIVPELDVPGHTVAALAAFPEWGCKLVGANSVVVGKTDNRMLCAAREDVYRVYDDIIGEVASVFTTSRFIHLGGDEAALERNWSRCERCRRLMDSLRYEKPSQLMGYFFAKILTSVRKHGKQPMLWCELDNIYMPAHEYLFDYPKDVTLVTWRNGLTPKCIELTERHGNRLVMAPGEYAYLDYPQWKGDLPEYNNWGMPVTSLEKVYRFDPGYSLPLPRQKHILGVMGTLWGEAIKDIHRATYMAYPRGLALAEAGWTQMGHRNWDSFRSRMYPNLMDMMKKGVSVRVPFEVAPLSSR